MSPSDYAWFRNVFFFSKSHADADWNKLSPVPEHILYIYDIEAGVAFLDLMKMRPIIDYGWLTLHFHANRLKKVNDKCASCSKSEQNIILTD